MGVDDAYVDAELARAATYSVVYLRAGPRSDHPDRDAIVGAHVKRNFQLKLDGAIAVVGPMLDDGDVRGLYIFNRLPEDADALIAADPAVEAGIFVYEVQQMMAFPGDVLA